MTERRSTIDVSLQVGPWARSELTGALHEAMVGRYGYRPLAVAFDRSTYARTRRPRWAVAAAILTAPTLIGLAFLLVRRTETFIVMVSEDHAGIRVRVHGNIDRRLLGELKDICARGPSKPVAAANGVGSAVLNLSSPPAAPSGTPIEAPVGVAAVAVPHPPVPLASPVSNPWISNSSSSAVDGATVMVPRGVAQAGSPVPAKTLLLRMDDGRLVDVRSSAVIGRNPRRSDGDGDAELIVVDHDTVSKTHLMVGVSDGVAWAVDRHSTNGTVHLDQHGRETRLEAGQRIPLAEGTALRVGGVWIRIEGVR